MTASQHCPHCGNTVKPALTRKRSRRHVENDEYAAFTRRVLRGLRPPHRGTATSTPSGTLTGCSVKSRPRSAGLCPACATTRLLPGRDRPTARRHPPGRSPALGRQPAMTPRGAAAAIVSEPDGSGAVATADDVITFADLKDLRTAARQHWHLRAPGQAARPRHCHRPGHRRGRPGLRHRLRTGRCAARRVRQPPRNTLSGLLGHLQARRPPARPRGPRRRQGRPRNGRCPPVRVRHAHRAVVRPSPRPPHARQHRAALPPPPRR